MLKQSEVLWRVLAPLHTKPGICDIWVCVEPPDRIIELMLTVEAVVLDSAGLGLITDRDNCSQTWADTLGSFDFNVFEEMGTLAYALGRCSGIDDLLPALQKRLDKPVFCGLAP